MAEDQRIHIAHESDIVAARRASREVAATLGFSSGELSVIATAISEIARNIVVYAKRGEISLELVEKNGRRGIRVIAVDHFDPAALRPNYKSSAGPVGHNSRGVESAAAE